MRLGIARSCERGSVCWLGATRHRPTVTDVIESNLASDFSFRPTSNILNSIFIGTVCEKGTQRTSMRTFFHSWRRRVGCVLLLFAFMYLLGWLRSRMPFPVHKGPSTIINEFRVSGLPFSPTQHVVIIPDELIWISGTADLHRVSRWHAQEIAKVKLNDLESWTCRWRAGFAGLSAGSHEALGIRLNWWRVPYWAIVWPLTLLSAYLILWKPRKREPSTKSLVSDETGCSRVLN